MTKKTKSKKTKSKKTQNWFSRLFSGNTKNNVPLSKKKDIAKKWCKKQKMRISPNARGRCKIHQDLCKCVGDDGEYPINNRFRWKFGYNSIKYNKSSKCNKIYYKKMKV